MKTGQYYKTQFDEWFDKQNGEMKKLNEEMLALKQSQERSAKSASDFNVQTKN